MTFVYCPKSFTWNECYVINEIIEKYDYPTYDFEFNVLDQYRFYDTHVKEEQRMDYTDELIII